MSNSDLIELLTFIIVVLLPVCLLVIYAILDVIAYKTKSRIDDYLVNIIGEILEGLGKIVPKRKK